MNNKKYFAAAVGAFVIWGFFSFALKPMHIYPSLDILFYRVFFSSIFMCLSVLIFRKKMWHESVKIYTSLSKKEKTQSILLTFLGGLLLTANWLFFIYSMNNISIKAASYAYLICPILTTVLAYFILNDKLTKWQWTAVLISFISCALLAYNTLRDLLFSMIVATSYALYLISQSKNNRFDKFLVLTFQMVFAALILLPFFPFYASAPPTEISFYAMILLIAIVFTVLPLFLNLYALKGVNSSTMGILLYINPLLNFIIAILYFNETTTTLQLISYSLILFSIFLFNLKAINALFLSKIN